MHGATLRFLRQYFRPREDGVEVSETTFTRGADQLPASIYRQRGRKTYRTAWVVLHGITYRGRQHKGLQRFASSMAAAGHFVLIPEIPEWSRFQVAPAVAVPTIREADGLALSSRNRYLSPAQRKMASALPQVMQETVAELRSGAAAAPVVAAAKARLHKAGFDRIDYLELCDEQTLQPIASAHTRSRLFVAAYMGTTRLIDNWPVI